MWDLLLYLWNPTLAVLIGVLFVNFFVPIKTRLDHSMATAASAGVVEVVLGLVERPEDVAIKVIFVVIVSFIADFISTFISFTNRIRNAIVTAIVFAPLYFGVLGGLYFLILWLDWQRTH
jgi:phage-related protein